MEAPSHKDEKIIATIDSALAEYDSVVESWRVEDHRLAIEATANYEAWLTDEQNGQPISSLGLLERPTPPPAETVITDLL